MIQHLTIIENHSESSEPGSFQGFFFSCCLLQMSPLVNSLWTESYILVSVKLLRYNVSDYRIRIVVYQKKKKISDSITLLKAFWGICSRSEMNTKPPTQADVKDRTAGFSVRKMCWLIISGSASGLTQIPPTAVIKPQWKKNRVRISWQLFGSSRL